MSNKSIVAFVAGAAIGAYGTWTYAKKYFNDMIDETVKKYSACEAEDQPKIESKPETEEEEDEPAEEEDSDPEKTKYHKAVKEYAKTKDESKKGPYIIDADEFRDGTMDTCVTYSYFEDGVVTDEYDNIVEDVDEAIGEDFVNHFDDDDVVYVRNEERRCDYEILREGFTYNDPPQTEE